MRYIFAIQLKRIGDLILTVPALEAVRRVYPATFIALVIDEDTAGMAPAIRCVDRIMVYRKNSLNFHLYRRLIMGRFDATLDFTGTDRSSLLTSLSKAQRRVTFRWADKNQLRSSAYNQWIDSPVREKHTVDHYMDLLAGIDVLPGDPALHLELPKSAYTRAREVLRARRVASSYVVLHAGAARAEKYWAPERWAAVIEHCELVLQRPCVLIGGNSEMEKEAIEAIRFHSKVVFVDLSGHLNLMASAALIAGADLFVGIDSGPAHLACAMHTPQVTLFGPTNPFHWRARHRRSIVLQGGKQNPLVDFDPHSSPGDLNALSTGEVLHAINLLLPVP